MLFAVIEAPESVKDVRDQRKQAFGLIIGQVLQMAAYIQQNFPAGWSESYQLKMPHKLWLDPLRGEQEEQQSFKEQREQGGWIQPVLEDFSRWLNNLLQAKFKKMATDFDDVEYHDWLQEIKAAVKASQRSSAGVF